MAIHRENLSAILIVSMLAACKTYSGNRSPDGPALITPRQANEFNTAQLSYKSFRSVPIDKRCDGIMLFFREFLAQDVKDITLASNSSCRYTNYKSLLTNVVTLTLERGAEKLHLLAFFQTYNNPSEFEFKIMAVNGTYSAFNPQQAQSQIEADLINLPSAFTRWLKSTDGELTINEISYVTFIDAFMKKYTDASNEVAAIAEPELRFELQPAEANSMTGKVKFSEVAAPHFKGPAGRAPLYLGCPDLGCLNDGQTSFQIEEDVLTVYRRSPWPGPVNFTKTAVWNLFYRISAQGLTELGRYESDVKNAT